MKRVLLAAALMLAACDAPPNDAIVDVGGGRPGDPATLTPANLPAFFDCLREQNATLISAHRGGRHDGLTENSIENFEATLAHTPAFMETDIGRTRDGVLVLMHDDTVDRTTNGSGDVSSMTAAQFQALRLRDYQGNVLATSPPTLRQALDWADGKTVLELDVKRGVSYEDVAREVEAAGAMDRVIFITYSVDGASRIASIAPHAMIYTTVRSVHDLDTLERRGAELSNIVAWLGDGALDDGLATMLNARGVEARQGLFERYPDFAAAMSAGVQSVSVNDPEAAYRAIDAADGRDGYAATQCAR
ncbi:MAG: glycerophosphodiester phosphodiesterase family protein [Alphaproteobacteria bacterium]|nr:glycerophosphodiester phosphodiesterase family protein [Alphaproteobacteria bacterium]